MPCAVGWGFQKKETSCFLQLVFYFLICAFFTKTKRVPGGVKQRDPIVAAVLRFCANRTQSFGARRLCARLRPENQNAFAFAGHSVLPAKRAAQNRVLLKKRTPHPRRFAPPGKKTALFFPSRAVRHKTPAFLLRFYNRPLRCRALKVLSSGHVPSFASGAQTCTRASIVCFCVPPPINSPRLMPQSAKSRPWLKVK